jgi:hypothetical protein
VAGLAAGAGQDVVRVALDVPADAAPRVPKRMSRRMRVPKRKRARHLPTRRGACGQAALMRHARAHRGGSWGEGGRWREGLGGGMGVGGVGIKQTARLFHMARFTWRAVGGEGGQVRSTCNGSAPGFAQARGVGAQVCSRAAAGR